MKRFLLIALVTTGVITSVFGESTVVLKSGETFQGDIISDTNDVLQIRAYRANRTISFLRDIPHADIHNIQTENAAQAVERTDCEALSKFQLNPNQEQSADYCGQVVATFQKFLIDYPKSDKVAAIQQRLEAWQAELRHVSDGEVKFGNKWMTAEDKRPLVEQWQKQNAVKFAQNALQLLKSNLADLQRQRANAAENLGASQGKLAGAQTKLATLQDTEVPIYSQGRVTDKGLHTDGRGNVISTGMIQTGPQRFTGSYQIVPNPERPKAQGEIQFYQQQVGQGQAALATLDAKIADVQSQIPTAERNYQSALIQSQEPPKLVVAKVEQPPSAPPPPPPPPPPPQPKPEPTPAWYLRAWKWLHE